MTTVLFVTWDGGGNVPPALGIAEELRTRGATVRFLGHESQRSALEGAGFAFEAYRHAGAWSVVEPRSGPTAPLAYAAVFTDRGIGTDLVESLGRASADRVVIDGLLIGAMSGARAAGIPYTILVHTLRSVMTRTLESGPLGLIMRLRGLDPRRLYHQAEGELVTTLRALDTAAVDTPTVLYTGPVLPEVHEARTDTQPPTVLASLSTTYIHTQQRVLQAILDAAAPLPLRVIATTGPAVDPGRLRVPGNATVHAFVPHGEIMDRASLVIGHGGHATTMLALAHGLPLLVLPLNPTFDQPAIGRLVAASGAGLVLRKSVGPTRIREAIEELLRTDRYRGAAREVGDQLRARPGAALAADALHPESVRS